MAQFRQSVDVVDGDGEKDVAIVYIDGSFETEDCTAFAAHVGASVDEGRPRVVVNMTNMTYINSTALGALLRANTLLRQYGGRFVVCGAQGMPAEVFTKLHFATKFPIVDTLEEALRVVREPAPEEARRLF